MATNEPIVSVGSVMPNKYCFVRKGNVYVTRNCRKLTHKAQETLYVVTDGNGSKQIGIRCPSHILHAVNAMERTTRSQRAGNVEKRDAAIANDFRKNVVKVYPHIPSTEISMVVKHALKKHSGRVGRTGNLEIQNKVKLAVRAHIRHNHTNYDALLREGVTRGEARKNVYSKVIDVAKLWGEMGGTAALFN